MSKKNKLKSPQTRFTGIHSVINAVSPGHSADATISASMSTPGKGTETRADTSGKETKEATTSMTSTPPSSSSRSLLGSKSVASANAILCSSDRSSSYSSNAVVKELMVVYRLQNKDADDMSCDPDKILINSSDMKAIGISAGAIVIVNESLVYRAWPTRQHNKGTCVLNKAWSLLFQKNMKARTAVVSKPKRWV